MTGPVTLVTGASGFIGRHFCETLVGSGASVRGLALTADEPLVAGVERVVGDLADPNALARAVAGAHTVVHLAARVHVMRETAPDALLAFRRTNVEGTRALLSATVNAGARRFLFVSSVKAVAERSAVPLTEHTPPAPEGAYGISKLEAEAMVRGMASEAALDAVILRLPLVYGPGMKGNLLQLFRMVDRGVPLPFAAVENRRSLLFVGNLVAAALAALETPAAAGETFFVSDGRDLSTPELIRQVAHGLDRPARLLLIRPDVLRVFAGAVDAVYRPGGRAVASPALDRLSGSLRVDTSKLQQLTGYVPPFEVEDGLRLTAEWFRGGHPSVALPHAAGAR